VIVFSLVSVVPGSAVAMSAAEGAKIAIELRGNIRVGTATWKHYGQAAEDIRDANIAMGRKLIEEAHGSYMQGHISAADYVRLRESRHRLNAAAQREYTERRNLNQRMKINARKSEVISRIPFVRWFKRGWVYTPDRAEKAIGKSRVIQSQIALVKQLKKELAEGARRKGVDDLSAKERDRTSFRATCVFMSKQKQGMELGRRDVSAETKQELEALVKEHCETDHFDVTVEYK
jgi:hypothetical protein